MPRRPLRVSIFRICCACSAALAAAAASGQPAVTAGPAARSAAAMQSRVAAGIASARVERAAPDRAAVTLALEPGAANLELLDAQGKAVAVRRGADGTLRAEVDPRRGYILTPQKTGLRPLTKEGVEFPARYMTFTPAGGTNLGGLFLRPTAVPLTWDDERNAYATELFVGYEFLDGAERALPVPRTVAFFVEGSRARIQADRVVIERSGGSGYKRVVLTTGETEGETRFTARVGPGDELQTSVTVQREPGALTLSLPAAELIGYGIGAAAVTVGVLGRDGSPLVLAAPMDVQLTGRNVRTPATLVIPAGKSSVAGEVRTTGIGAGEIRAQSGALRAVLPVMLLFPTAPIVAAFAGGALGGAARYLRNRRKKGALLLRRIAEGVIVGIVIVGAVWAGLVTIDVSAGVLGTPFGAFVLAALSGYLGCVVLDRVANRTFAGVRE